MNPTQNKTASCERALLLNRIDDRPLSIGAHLFNTMENETWKDILGYDYSYQINNFGVVRVLDRKTCAGSQIRKGRKKIIEGRILKARVVGGYSSVGLRKNKKTYNKKISRLIAMAFILNPENKPQINHKNGIKLDNKIDINDLYGKGTNLEWVTGKENTNHAYETGLSPIGEKAVGAKIKNSDIAIIVSLHKQGMKGAHIAKKFSVCKGTIYSILNGDNWGRWRRQNNI